MNKARECVDRRHVHGYMGTWDTLNSRLCSTNACVRRQVLNGKGYAEPLREYIRADRPFFGICLGMQTLFEGSEECPGVAVSLEVLLVGPGL
jgi:hypothetical protein